MLLGKHLKFLQSVRSNKVRAVKHSIDDGASFLIAVLPKLSSDRLSIIPVNFGIELILKQPKRSRTIRDCILSDMIGRSVRDSECRKCKCLSPVSCPMDGWISTKLTHPTKFSTLSFGTLEKSGVRIRFLE